MKKRLDMLLVERGHADSREKAQRLIRAGLVYTDGEKLDKPGKSYDDSINLFLKGSDCPYVSRGGLKLEGALDHFVIDVDGMVALDLGASTGGFTDCLLQHGATKVYAIDVGRGQLHQRLQLDNRVISREKTHIDSLRKTDFSPPPSIVVADLSFISLRRCFPVIGTVMEKGSFGILLVKPQFEVGKDRLPKGGVVTSERDQLNVLNDLKQVAEEEGLTVTGHCDSPIKGGDGNREFFLSIRV